jgi:hypothetical protein
VCTWALYKRRKGAGEGGVLYTRQQGMIQLHASTLHIVSTSQHAQHRYAIPRIQDRKQDIEMRRGYRKPSRFKPVGYTFYSSSTCSTCYNKSIAQIRMLAWCLCQFLDDMQGRSLYYSGYQGHRRRSGQCESSLASGVKCSPLQ